MSQSLTRHHPSIWFNFEIRLPTTVFSLFTCDSVVNDKPIIVVKNQTQTQTKINFVPIEPNAIEISDDAIGGGRFANNDDGDDDDVIDAFVVDGDPGDCCG